MKIALEAMNVEHIVKCSQCQEVMGYAIEELKYLSEIKIYCVKCAKVID